MPPTAPGRRWLTRIFATVGAVIMILTAVGLSSVIRQMSTAQLHEVAQQNSTALGRAAANRIWPQLRKVYAGNRLPTPVPKGGSTLEPITGPVSKFLTEAGVLGITLYAPSGQMLFTTGAATAALEPFRQARLDRAAAGEIDSHLDLHEVVETADGLLRDRWLVSTFAPFRAGDGETVDAIVEIVADTTELHQMALGAETRLLTIIGAAFVLAFSLLLAMVWRANVRSDAHHAGHIEHASRTAKADAMALVETLMAAWPDVVYLKDTASRFVMANTATAHLMGAETAEDLIGKTDFDFLPPDAAKDFFDSEQRMLATGRPVVGRVEHAIRPDGGTIWYTTTKMPYRDATGQTAGFIGISRDVTEERHAATELRQAKEDAEYASRTKSEFLANMSHELRTPLNAIIGFSEIIKSEAFGPVGTATYKEYAKDINDSGAHLLAVINDILDLSKVESGNMELNLGDVALDDIVRSVKVLVRERAQHASVLLDFPPQQNLSVLRADETKLKQILVNLLSNAIKFTEPGGHVSLTVETDGGSIVLKVADTGIGIPADAIAKAMKPFGQVDSQLSRRYEGSGLGLPLAKRLTELHGGELSLESEVDHGTTVTVRIPAGRTIRVLGTA